MAANSKTWKKNEGGGKPGRRRLIAENIATASLEKNGQKIVDYLESVALNKKGDKSSRIKACDVYMKHLWPKTLDEVKSDSEADFSKEDVDLLRQFKAAPLERKQEILAMVVGKGAGNDGGL